MEYVFNRDFPKLVSPHKFFFEPEDIQALPYLKYVPYQKALPFLSPSFQDFLSHFPSLDSGYAYCFLDVKPQFLRAGENPCVSGWHIDMVDNPLKNNDSEVHFLYSWGLDSPTLFLGEPFSVDIPNPHRSALPLVHREIALRNPSFRPVEQGRIYRFERHHLHHCGTPTVAGWRLLVRKSYSNVYRSPTIKCT